MWTWRLQAADGSPIDNELNTAHSTQSDAESWLGETWRELAASGVAQVSLFEDENPVYGPMPLSEA